MQKNIKLDYYLRMRALVSSSLIDTLRLIEIFEGKGGWFAEKTLCDDKVTDNCIGKYNKELMDPLEPVFSKILIALVVLSAVSNIFAIKKRWLVDHFLKIECLTRIMAIMIPNPSGYAHRTDQLHVFAFGVVFGTVFCGRGSDIIVCTLTLLFHMTVGTEVNYGSSDFD